MIDFGNQLQVIWSVNAVQSKNENCSQYNKLAKKNTWFCRKKFAGKCKSAQTTKIAKLVANEKKLHRTLTKKLFDYTSKVTGQCVSYEFSQLVIVSIIYV